MKLTKENEDYKKELSLIKKLYSITENPFPEVKVEPSIGGIRPEKIDPDEIRKRIQELERKIKVNEFIISEQKAILDTFGITLNETKYWEGDWYISWEGDEQIWYEMDELKEPLTFEFRDGVLIGKYGYRTKDGIVNGEIKEIKISANCLKGHYYEKGGGEDGNGTVEFLMFPERKYAFIGRYKRRKSTLLNVDDNYKIWIGKRKR